MIIEPRWVLSPADHPLPSPSLPGEASPRKQFYLLIAKNVRVVCVGFCSVELEMLFWAGV